MPKSLTKHTSEKPYSIAENLSFCPLVPICENFFDEVLSAQTHRQTSTKCKRKYDAKKEDFNKFACDAQLRDSGQTSHNDHRITCHLCKQSRGVVVDAAHRTLNDTFDNTSK